MHIRRAIGYGCFSILRVEKALYVLPDPVPVQPELILKSKNSYYSINDLLIAMATHFALYQSPMWASLLPFVMFSLEIE